MEKSEKRIFTSFTGIITNVALSPLANTPTRVDSAYFLKIGSEVGAFSRGAHWNVGGLIKILRDSKFVNSFLEQCSSNSCCCYRWGISCAFANISHQIKKATLLSKHFSSNTIKYDKQAEVCLISFKE